MSSSHASGKPLEAIPDAAAGWTVAALGVAIVLGATGYWWTTDGSLFNAVVVSLPGAATALGWGLARYRGLDEEFHPRLLKWTLTGGGVLGGLILVVVLFQGTPLVESVPLLLFMTGVGTTGGVAIGANEARSVVAAREAERMKVSAEHVREERDRLRFLNNLLRHNVLNKINVVQAYTRDVAERHDGSFDAELETALEQSREIAEVIENVRLLVRATTEETDRRPLGLTPTVASAIDSVGMADATVETSLPENCWVVADDLLQYAVENLLRNAVQHHDGDEPTVRVTATTSTTGDGGDHGTVRLRVADDGPGIPDPRKGAVLEPGERGDSGLGLYLVQTVVEGYGGSVAIQDNDPRGTVVELTLPQAQRSA